VRDIVERIQGRAVMPALDTLVIGGVARWDGTFSPAVTVQRPHSVMAISPPPPIARTIDTPLFILQDGIRIYAP
jgi:hypothetical protein